MCDRAHGTCEVLVLIDKACVKFKVGHVQKRKEEKGNDFRFENSTEKCFPELFFDSLIRNWAERLKVEFAGDIGDAWEL